MRKLLSGRPPRLSRAQLETLAIIAYRQPVTRGEIEDIRGVSVSPEIMQRLQEREWIKQVGVRDTPGRPALFGTTPEFLAYFSLESLNELPPLMEQRDFGEISRDLDVPLPPEVLEAMEAGLVENQQDVFEFLADRDQQPGGGNDSESEGNSDADDERDSITDTQDPDAAEEPSTSAAEAEFLEPDAESA